MDRLGRLLTEVLELLGWLRENEVEVISLRESIDQDSAIGRAMLHLAIVFAEMERDLARERTLAGLERVKATGKLLGRRKGVSRKRAEEITEHAPSQWTFLGSHFHDNRTVLQQYTPDLHLGPRGDSADRFRGGITGPLGHGMICQELCCLGNNGQRLECRRCKGMNTVRADTSYCPLARSKVAKCIAASLTAALRAIYNGVSGQTVAPSTRTQYPGRKLGRPGIPKSRSLD